MTLRQQIAELTSQKGSLLAALKYAIKIYDIKCRHPHPGPDFCCTACIAIKAIRRAE